MVNKRSDDSMAYHRAIHKPRLWTKNTQNMPQVFQDFFSDMKLGMFLTVHFKDAVIVLLFKNFKNFRLCLNRPSPYIMSLFCDLFLPREDDINYEFNLHEPYATAAMRRQNATIKIFNSLLYRSSFLRKPKILTKCPFWFDVCWIKFKINWEI